MNITKAMIETVLNTMDSLKIRQQQEAERKATLPRVDGSDSTASSMPSPPSSLAATTTTTTTTSATSTTSATTTTGGNVAHTSSVPSYSSIVRPADYSSGSFQSFGSYAQLKRNASVSTLTWKEEDALQQRLQKKFYPFVICNQSGMPIWYWLNGAGEIDLKKLADEKVREIHICA
jgi:hypothetical protein